MPRAFITGGTGFVGSHTVERFLDAGWTVRALVRDANRLSWLKNLPVEIAVANLTDKSALEKTLVGCDVIVHCAGLTKALRESDFFKVNADAVGILTETAERAGVRRFVLCSSQASAGPSTGNHAKREDEPDTPISTYGQSKLAGEVELKATAKKLEWVILRPPSVMGPRDTQFVPLFRAVANFGLYPRWGSGTQKYSLIYVKDLARALLHVSDHSAANAQTFFVGMKDPMDWQHVAQVLGNIANKRVRALHIPLFAIQTVAPILELIGNMSGKPALLSREKMREIRAEGWICDSSKIRDSLGFACEYDLETMLRETLIDYRTRSEI